MDLEIAIENATFQLEQALKSITNKTEDSFKGHAYIIACQAYRKLACLNLQLHANQAAFIQHLRASVSLWLTFCRLTKSSNAISDECLCGTQFHPLFDALVLGDLDKAFEIASFFPEKIQTDWEYEEDYLYFKFLCNYLSELKGTKVESPKNILAHWENIAGVLGGDFLICQGLIEGKKNKFFNGLMQLIEEREKNFDEWKETTSYNPEVEYCNRYIYINGLGLLRIAEISNMKINEITFSLPKIAILPIS